MPAKILLAVKCQIDFRNILRLRRLAVTFSAEVTVRRDACLHHPRLHLVCDGDGMADRALQKDVCRDGLGAGDLGVTGLAFLRD